MRNIFKLRIIVVAACIFIFLSACADATNLAIPQYGDNTSATDLQSETESTPSVGNPDEPFKIFIATDTHVFFDDMHDDSDTFRNFDARDDGKMLAYSDHIIGAFVNDVLTEKPDAVILSGDLSLNGEKRGHEALAERMNKIIDAGIPVLVIPGNHDINNPFAREIHDAKFQKAEHVSPADFEQIYRFCGYDEPAYRDPNSLSYIIRLNEDLYAVMLDSCVYETNIEQNISAASGALRPGTLEWIESSVKDIKQNPQARFITVMHHNLIMHHRFFNSNYVIKNSEDAVQRLSDLGLSVFFSGHIHIQHILSKTASNGKAVTEVVNSSQVVYPAAYGVAQFDKNGMKYHMQPVNMRNYAETNGFTDINLLNFEDYSKVVFNRGDSFISKRLLELGYSDEDALAASETVGLLNTYFFAGRVDDISEKVKNEPGYQVIKESGIMLDYVDSILEDAAGEHTMIEIAW